MAGSISALLIPCLKAFNQLHEQVGLPDYGRETEVSPAAWGDELGRLRVWAANIGAHQTGQSSLDFRLRDASHISKQITNLLRDLEQSLHDIFDELSEDGDEALDEDDETWPGTDSTTELQQLHEEVVNIIDCLYQLSMLIRKPAEHDMFVGSRTGDMAQFEFYDKEHVRNLHPKTEEQIGQRLGYAITRRRKYLFYRERHHKKLEKGIEEAQGIQRATAGSVISETIASDFKTSNIDFEETSSNSGISQTSYAPSLTDGGRVTIPPPPRDSVGGKPFECPYCFFVIDIKSTRSWNRHIFKDIKPYVCTFPECSMPDRLYDSRREWYFHETTEHRREEFVCSLCKDTLKSSKQYERHVARHLEELALFALPRIDIDDAEDDEDDALDARTTTSNIDDSSDSLGDESPMEVDGREVEGRKASLDFQDAKGRIDKPSSSLGTLLATEPVVSDNTLERKRYSEDFSVPDLAYGIHGDTDDDKAPYTDPSRTLAPFSSLARAEATVAAVIENADKKDQSAAETDEAAAIAKPPLSDKYITLSDALGRRLKFPFHAVNTWSGMEHLIKEIFLDGSGLGLRVADGQYDLWGPHDEILSPSNWASMIQPGWKITMRMWPNPERPPWEYAGPRAMLQDRHNIRSGKQNERLQRSVSQQEENDLYERSEYPRLGELQTYTLEEPTTPRIGGIEIEERTHNEPRRKRLNFVRDHSQDPDEWEEVPATRQEQVVPYTNSENPRRRASNVYRRRKPTADGDIIVVERRPRRNASLPPKRLSFGGHGSDSDEWEPPQLSRPSEVKLSERDTKQKPVIVGGRGSEIENQSLDEAKMPSDETHERTAPRPFRKEAPFGPYHHYQGGR